MDNLGSRPVKDLIAAALVESDEHVLSEIILTLQSRGTLKVFDAAYKLCVEQDAQKRILGFRILEDLGAFELTFPGETLDLTLHLLETESDAGVLASMARVLARVGGPQAIEALENLTKNSSSKVRAGIMMAISYFLKKEDRSKVISTVLLLLQDSESEIRFEAAGFFTDNSDMDTEDIRKLLTQAASDTNSGVRGRSLLALVRRSDPHVLDLLLNELKSDQFSVAAIKAAAELKAPALYPLLQEISTWWDVDTETLKDAMRKCKPG